MEEPGKTCASCRHFRRHYVRRGNHWYMPLAKGHCVSPRLKDRTAETPACLHYAPKPPKEEEDPV